MRLKPMLPTTAAVRLSAHLPHAVTDIPHRGLKLLYCENDSAPYKELAVILHAYCI